MTHRFAVIGCGSIGKRHIRNLLACGVRDIVGIDPSPERQAEARVLGVQAAASLDQSPIASLTAAIIASPNIYHRDNLRHCADLGLHVLVEKPLAVSSRGLDEIVTEFESKRLVGHVGSNFKFHPSFARMREELPSIGRVLAARAVSGQYLPDWHPWEDYRQGYSANTSLGGGVLLDTHELLYLTWFVGPAAEVACLNGKVSDLEIDTEDLAQIVLRHRCGALSTIQADYLQRSYHRTYEFTGTEGSLMWDVNAQQVRRYSAASNTWTVWDEPRGYDLNTMYADQTRHFLAAVEAGNPDAVATPLAEGLAVLRLTEAAKLSQAERRIVSLSQ